MRAIVAPPDDCSMVRTRDCFEAGFAVLAPTVLDCEATAAVAASLVTADCFFADFDMEVLRSVDHGWRRTTEAPRQPSGQLGRTSRRLGTQVRNTTAPIAAEC